MSYLSEAISDVLYDNWDENKYRYDNCQRLAGLIVRELGLREEIKLGKLRYVTHWIPD